MMGCGMGAVYFPVPMKSIAIVSHSHRITILIAGLYRGIDFSDSAVSLSNESTSHSRTRSLNAITPPL